MAQTPRQRRKAKSRESILDAAARLIVTKGYENVSLREIAKLSDYSPAGLYKHFDSKMAIIQAVQERENGKLLEFLATVDANISPEDHLIELCMRYIRFGLDNRVFVTLINNLSSERKSKAQPVPTGSPYLVFFQAVHSWTEAESIVNNPDYGLEEITFALWSLIHGMTTLRLNQLKDFEADFDSATRNTLKIFFNGLRQEEKS